MSTLLGIAIGIIVGWNLPQPAWARELQEKIVASIKRLSNRLGG